MNTTLNKKEQGFTIIEVVLVLAIAGLIFLIVFLALPQLQSSRRDTQRKNDAGRLLAALENWAGNHSGNYPQASELNAANGAGWVTANVAGDFSDPDGTAYAWADAFSATADEGTFAYATAARCSTTADGFDTSGSPGPREVAVAVTLENGSYCQDNQ